MINSKPEVLTDALYKCGRCSYCRGYGAETPIICPAYELTDKLEVASPKGRLQLARRLLERSIRPSKELSQAFFLCSLCGSCKDKCIEGIDTTEVFEVIRGVLVEENVGIDIHSKFTGSVIKNNNPYFEPHEKRFAWLPKHLKTDNPITSEYAYFVGCTSAYRRQPIAVATTEILQKAHIKFTFIDEVCCGSPLLRTGHKEVAKKLAMKNIKTIAKTGVKKVVTSCAGCYRTLKQDYAMILEQELPFEIIHSTELLAELIKDGRLELSDDKLMKVTYHDPCHLGRHAGVYDPPRDVLKSIPDIKFVEMPENRNNALCCGAGGGFRSGYNDLSIELAALRVSQVKKIDVKILTSSCPFCHYNLELGRDKIDKNVKIIDINELIVKRLL
ncbi:MAG: (Fe-S)-binding protein [Promethearchaeota archaeon]